MASEGGGKIRNKRGHSSGKPYERRKSLFSRITDSIKDVLRPSWLSPEVSGDDGSVVLVGAEPLAASDEQQGNTVHAGDPQPSSQPPFWSEFGSSTAGGLQSDALHHNQSAASASGGKGSVAQAQTYLSNQHSNMTESARFSWQQQQHHLRQVPLQQAVSTSATFVPQSDSSHFVRGYSTPNLHKRQGAGMWQSGMDRWQGPPSAVASTSELPTAHMRQRRLRLSESEVIHTASTLSSVQGAADNLDPSSPGGSGSLPGLATPDISTSTSETSEAKRQRLWSPETPRRGRALQPETPDKPMFKISVFCSPNQNLNESVHESSFYSGRTTFGGASAYRRRNLNTSLPYQNSLPLRKPVKAKPLNNSSNAVLSSSATQILKTLERLSAAKKAEASETGTDSILSFTPSSYRKPSRPLQVATPSRAIEIPVRGPPISRLQSPGVASIAKNRQIATLTAPRSQRQPSSSQTQDTDDGDVQVIEDPSEKTMPKSSSAFSYQDVPSASGSGKMKRSKTYETRPKARREDEEVLEAPSLRTDFTLPLQGMPAFNLGPNLSLPVTSKPASVTSTRDSTGTPALQFTFSSPIQKSGPSPSGTTPSTTEGFQFSSPLRVCQTVPPSLDKSPVNMFGSTSACTSARAAPGFGPQAWGSTAPKAKTVEADTFHSTFKGGDKSSSQLSEGLGASGTSSISVASASSSDSPPKPAAQLLSGSVMDILGGGKSDAAAAASPSMSGLKPASSLRQGSVMDILGKESASSNSGADDLMAKFKQPAGSWECGTCMVQNKPDASKCVCCETPKPGASSSGADNLMAKFKQPAGSWECGTCMVQNKPDVPKCVCCDTPKPGASSAATTSSVSSPAVPSGGTDSLFAKFLKPAGAWECEMCLVQNKADATKCVACETPKPGSKPAAQASAAKTDDLFAKFCKPAGSWDCEVCLVQNTEAQTRCLACESPRPGTQSAGSAPSGGSSSVINPSAQTEKGTSSTGFTFGGTSVSTVSSGSGFTFGGASINFGDVRLPTGGGFKMPSVEGTASKNSSTTSGFKFGDQDLSNSNSASTKSGVTFGNVDPSKPQTSPAASLSGGFKFGDGVTGFQFGSASAMPSASVSVGSSQVPVTSHSLTFTPASTSVTSSTVPSSSFSTASASAGFVFGAPSSAASGDTSTASNGVSASKNEGTEKESARTFSPVFGLGQPVNNNSLGASPSLATGGFQFGVSASTGSPSVFGSNLSAQVTVPESTKKQSASSGPAVDGAKQTISGGFSFQAAVQPNNEVTPQAGLFASAVGGKNGESSSTSGFSFGSTSSSTTPAASNFVFGSGAASTTTATATPSAFVFGSNSAITTTTSTTSVFGTAPQLNSWPADTGAKSILKPDTANAKPTVNGEVGAPSVPFVFGQQPASSSTTGFVFGSQTLNSSADSSGSQTKPAFAFGAAANSSTTTIGGKRSLNQNQNDTGPSKAKRGFGFSAETPLTSTAESFKFGNPAPAAAASGVFAFGQPNSGATEKAPSLPAFGGATTGFGSAVPTGLFSGGQGNAGSTQPVFGAGGSGSTSTGQFSFNMGTNSQSNAAAASAFPTGTTNSGFGFGFTPGTTPSFNFAASNSTSNPSGPVFQFGGTQAADEATTQPPGGSVFAFGQSTQPADSANPAPAFAAPSALAFGATGTPNFTVGAGEAPRKIKRAVRRGARK